MTTLIAIDGDYLNRALKKKAIALQSSGRDLPESSGNPRLRVDFAKLADFLAAPADRKNREDVLLHYYIDFPKPDASDRAMMGRVYSYFSDRGWGFISGIDGKSYFFHNQDLLNRRDLRIGTEERYPHPSTPEFRNRLIGKIVSFSPGENDGKSKADAVRIEQGPAIDKFFRLRREPFLTMLQDTGYKIIRCESVQPLSKAKDKSVDCEIYFDAMREVHDENDRFILVSDDPVFTRLIRGLREDGIEVSLIAFKSRGSEELSKHVDRRIFLDDKLEEIQLEYDDREGVELDDPHRDEHVVGLSSEQRDS